MQLMWLLVIVVILLSTRRAVSPRLHRDGRAGEQRGRALLDGQLIESHDFSVQEVINVLQMLVKLFASLSHFFERQFVRSLGVSGIDDSAHALQTVLEA